MSFSVQQTLTSSSSKGQIPLSANRLRFSIISLIVVPVITSRFLHFISGGILLQWRYLANVIVTTSRWANDIISEQSPDDTAASYLDMMDISRTWVCKRLFTCNVCSPLKQNNIGVNNGQNGWIQPVTIDTMRNNNGLKNVKKRYM